MTADVLVLTAAGIGCLLALPLLPQAPQPAAPRVEGRVIAPGATLEKLAGGFAFTEGPTSDRDGNVFFTDQPNNRILKWSVDGTLTTFLAAGGTVERDVLRRRRATCSPARTRTRSCGRSRRTASTRSSRAHTTGKPLNGPNDVWERPDGAIYFTDPFYKRDWWALQRAAAGHRAGLLPFG